MSFYFECSSLNVKIKYAKKCEDKFIRTINCIFTVNASLRLSNESLYYDISKKIYFAICNCDKLSMQYL
jgi:hypothetical protein